MCSSAADKPCQRLTLPSNNKCGMSTACHGVCMRDAVCCNHTCIASIHSGQLPPNTPTLPLGCSPSSKKALPTCRRNVRTHHAVHISSGSAFITMERSNLHALLLSFAYATVHSALVTVSQSLADRTWRT